MNKIYIRNLLEKNKIGNFLPLLKNKIKENKTAKYIEKLKKEYEKTYPDDYIEYIYKTDDIDGSAKYVFPSEYYDQEDSSKLKPEYQAYVDEGRIRPTLNNYIAEKLLEAETNGVKDVTITDDDILTEGYPYFEKLLMFLADKKLEEAKRYLAGKKVVTEDQLKRYEIKYQTAIKALNGDTTAVSKLALEAELLGQDPNEYIQIIKQMGDAWNASVEDFTSKIEAIRVGLQALFKNKDFEKALSIAEKVSYFDASVTDDEIKELFA